MWVVLAELAQGICRRIEGRREGRKEPENGSAKDSACTKYQSLLLLFCLLGEDLTRAFCDHDRMFNHTATFRRESDYPVSSQSIQDLQDWTKPPLPLKTKTRLVSFIIQKLSSIF